MPQKLLVWILKIGVFSSLLTVFFVFKSLLFPYITSKQISFNILMEFLLIFWIILLVKYPAWRPTRSAITIGLAAFFAAALASCFAGIDFNLSFWGDVERMLGVFHILHFFAFYLIIITVMRDWRDWRIFFGLSILFAIFVSFQTFSSSSAIYASIGNTAYVSGYLIFNIYFCLLLFFRDKQYGWRWAYLAPLLVFLPAFYRQETTGAFVGLGFSLIVVFFLYSLFAPGKRLKIGLMSVFLALSFSTVFLLINKDEDYIRQNRLLRPISGITFQKSTFQTRLISWRAALKDFPNHPLLGTGFGNYAIIFDKYFDPKFYNYTRGETYFDRAHNNLIDITSTTGLLGGLAYLSIFAFAFFYLWRGFFRKKTGLNTFVLANGLITAYFVQNLAVFDSLVTYVGIIIVLGFIFWLNRPDRFNYQLPPDKPWERAEVVTLFLSALVLVGIMYQYNILPLRMLTATINGQRAYQQGGIVSATEEYKIALSYQTVLDRDSRTSYNRLLLANPTSLKSLPPEKAVEVIEYNLELAEKNITYNPQDSLNQMILAQLLNAAAVYYSNQPEKFDHYSQRALAAIDASIASSPGRVPIYFQKAQILLTLNDRDKVEETLRYAISLNEKYPDGHCFLARTLMFFQKEEEAWQAMDRCVDMDSLDLILNADNVNQMVAGHYIEKKDYSRLATVYKTITRTDQKNTTAWINLAKIYAQSGRKDEAIKAAEKAAELEPNYRSYADEFINSLR